MNEITAPRGLTADRGCRLGLHVIAGPPATERATAQLAVPFDGRATGIGDPVAQRAAALTNLVRCDAHMLAYIDAFWLIAWASLLGILLILRLRPPLPSVKSRQSARPTG